MTVNFNRGGTEYVTALITEAEKNESRTATVTGKWIIDREIRLPSHFTLILEDCHLMLADGVYSNIFVNEHHGTEVGRTEAGTDRNISLIGRGEAILDGGNYNGLSEKNHSKDGLPPIWKNNLLLFTNVDGFKISGIKCRNQRWWALNFIYSKNGYIGNIDFCSSDVGVAPDGSTYHGLMREKYDEVLVKNSDGIDLRAGCQNILIENITGFTEDDTIALTGLCGKLERTFAVEGLSSDIAHVAVKNIRASAFCTIVRLLNQGDVKLHDILIDGVFDTSAECPCLDRGLYAVRIGDVRLYGTRHATEDETYNISIRNVVGRSDYAIALAGKMSGLSMYGIECREGCKMLLDNR